MTTQTMSTMGNIDLVGERVEAHPHRPRVLKYRTGTGSVNTVSARATRGGRVKYVSFLVLCDAVFAVQPAGPARVREVTGVRDVHAFVRGKCVAALSDIRHDASGWTPEQITAPWVLVSYNPFKADHFYEVLPREDGGHDAGRKVTAAAQVVMFAGDLIAINPTFQEA